MAFCRNCGKAVERENAKFCLNCGKPIRTNNQKPKQTAIDVQAQPPPTTPTPLKPGNKNSRIIICAVAVVLAAGAGVGFWYLSLRENSVQTAQDRGEVIAIEGGQSLNEAEQGAVIPESQAEPPLQVTEPPIDTPPQNGAAIIEDAGTQENAQSDMTGSLPEELPDASPALLDNPQMIMDTLYLYYTTYLDCLNQVSTAPLRGVTSSYDISSWVRNNSAYEFDFSTVIVDLDSLDITGDTGARVNVQFHYRYRSRGTSNAWTSTRSTQVVTLVYDEATGEWLIRDISINNNISLGGNQVIL